MDQQHQIVETLFDKTLCNAVGDLSQCIGFNAAKENAYFAWFSVSEDAYAMYFYRNGSESLFHRTEYTNENKWDNLG